MGTERLEKILKDEKVVREIRNSLSYERQRSGFVATLAFGGEIRVGEPSVIDESKYAEAKKIAEKYLDGPVAKFPVGVVALYYTMKSEALEQRLAKYKERHHSDTLNDAATILDTEWSSDPASEGDVKAVLQVNEGGSQSVEQSFALLPSISQIVALNEYKQQYPHAPVISLLGEHYPNRSENLRLLAVKSTFPHTDHRTTLQVWERLMAAAIISSTRPSLFDLVRPKEIELLRGIMDLDNELLHFD